MKKVFLKILYSSLFLFLFFNVANALDVNPGKELAPYELSDIEWYHFWIDPEDIIGGIKWQYWIYWRENNNEEYFIEIADKYKNVSVLWYHDVLGLLVRITWDIEKTKEKIISERGVYHINNRSHIWSNTMWDHNIMRNSFFINIGILLFLLNGISLIILIFLYFKNKKNEKKTKKYFKLIKISLLIFWFLYLLNYFL